MRRDRHDHGDRTCPPASPTTRRAGSATTAPSASASWWTRPSSSRFGFAPGPISVPFRTAPDLYTFRDRALPVEVRFRSPPGPIMDVAVSRLDIALNDVYLKSFPLREGDPTWGFSWIARQVGSSTSADRGEGRVGLPPYLVFGLNELQLRFDMRPLHRGDCVSIPATCAPRSTRTAPSIFPPPTASPSCRTSPTSRARGFPYTRMADLSETAVVLPDRANALEIASTLTPGRQAGGDRRLSRHARSRWCGPAGWMRSRTAT